MSMPDRFKKKIKRKIIFNKMDEMAKNLSF